METREVKIKEILDRLDQPKYRFNQILEAIYKQNEILNYSQISNLPKEVREALIAESGDSIPSLKEVTIQKDGETQKVLFETNDGNKIESVKMHYEGGRNTICVSVQVGCAMGCAFCATGKLGLARNLSADEIVDQILYFRKNGHQVDNVVFMGMGEPFANPATFEALEILIDQKKLGIGQRHISVSTVGIIPGIERMTKEQPQINLALSLHSPFQDQREKIMPIAKSYHIADIMDALERHILATNRKVLIAYILLDGVNDSEEHAVALAEMLKSYGKVSHLFHVNLINYHEVEGIDL
jgi:23S rRNA (adenine-C8)-methyltransferase